MKDTFNLPDYKRFIYHLAADTGYYQLRQLGKVLRRPKVPNELTKELGQPAKLSSITPQVLTYKNESGAEKLFTVLQPTVWPNWFTGEHLRRNNGVNIRSALLIHFNHSNDIINVFFFTGYPVEPEKQQVFSARVIPMVIKSIFIAEHTS